MSQPLFPLGDNIIADPDIRTFGDLTRYYPLPASLEYTRDRQGAPLIRRTGDGKTFTFVIEEERLFFDEPFVRPDGKTIYHTTEVFKQT